MQHPTSPQRKVSLRGQSAEVEADRVYEGIQTEQRRILLKTSQLIWLSFGVLEGIIGLRILLKLIGANPENPFTHLIYNITKPFLAPFVGLTTNPAANGLALEIHAIIALFVYVLLSVLIERLIWIIFSRPKV